LPTKQLNAWSITLNCEDENIGHENNMISDMIPDMTYKKNPSITSNLLMTDFFKRHRQMDKK
jgi:hypothetical protein